ncbi:MAG: PIN domain-containing protein [Actinomycetota bacterium]|nr:PIN domain-containing protein [Actinomycetota bacterium]
MAGPVHRRKLDPGQATTALVLDSDGLAKAAAGDPWAVAWVARARELRLPLVVNAVTLTETIRGGRRDVVVHLLIRNAHVDHVDAEFAADAGRLLGKTKRSDTIDALVATTAIRLKQPVVILTSDPNELTALTEDHPWVAVVGV